MIFAGFVARLAAAKARLPVDTHSNPAKIATMAIALVPQEGAACCIATGGNWRSVKRNWVEAVWRKGEIVSRGRASTFGGEKRKLRS